MSRHIAFFLPNLCGGGAEKVFLDLCGELARRDMRIDLVVGRRFGEFAERVPDRVRLFDLGSSRVLKSLPALTRYLDAEQPDTLFSTLDHGNVVAILARGLARHKPRLIVRVANNLTASYAHPRRLKSRLLPLLIKLAYPYADVVLAVSEGVADDVRHYCAVDPGKIRVIYNPVVTDDLLRLSGESSDLPRGWSAGRPVVLGVGSLTEQKDFSTLMKAFSRVIAEIPAQLVILGEGKERAVLDALAARLGIEDDVLMPGFVDNPFACMKQAALFVLSSRWEGLPNVLIQALACGCPVVSTNCPNGPDEIINSDDVGTLVPVADVDALADAISRALRKSPQTDSGRERANDFRIGTIASEYLALADDEGGL